MGADGNTYTEQAVVTDPAALATLPPGRYEVRDTGLWCEPAKINNAGVFTTFGEKKYLCAFPMNSCCILDQTDVVYGSVKNTDLNVAQHSTIIQTHLSEEYQAMHSNQFFDQDIDPIMRFVIYNQAETKP